MTESDSDQYKSRAARRQEMVKSRREERMQKYQRNQREMKIIKWGSIGLVVVILGAIGFAGFNYLKDRDLNRAPEGVVTYEYPDSGDHIDGVIDYAARADYTGEIPPAGGAHNPTPQQCAVYTGIIPVESAIHSLEHGAVWITYQPTLPQDQIDALAAKAEGDPYMLMSLYEGLPAPIVLTSWNHQLQMQAFDEELVEQFMRSYKNKRGVTPEFGASCAGTTMEVTP